MHNYDHDTHFVNRIRNNSSNGFLLPYMVRLQSHILIKSVLRAGLVNEYMYLLNKPALNTDLIIYSIAK